jgi:hypothetical protein
MRPEHTVGGYFRKNAELMAEYAKPASAPAPAAAAAAAPASPGEESPS